MSEVFTLREVRTPDAWRTSDCPVHPYAWATLAPQLSYVKDGRVKPGDKFDYFYRLAVRIWRVALGDLGNLDFLQDSLFEAAGEAWSKPLTRELLSVWLLAEKAAAEIGPFTLPESR